MAYRTGSRNAPIEPLQPIGPRTLSDVLDVVLRSPDLTARERQDRASALRTLSKLLGRPLATLPCEIRFLRSAIEKIAPARHRLSAGRWANVKSLVYRSLDLARVSRLPGRSSAPVSPAWADLIAPLPYRPFQVALLPFARFCSRVGIQPCAVDTTAFERFEAELDELSGRSRPREAFLDATRAWNKAAETHTNWPVFRIQIDDRRDRYALDWAAFPASLKADVDAMVDASVSPDPISPTSRRPIKPVSAETRVRMLRAFASALVHQGCDPAPLDSIRALVDLARAKSGLRFIYERAGKKKSTHLHQMAKLLCTLAQHWVGVSKEHLDQLKAIRKQLDPGRHGMTDKNRATLRCFEDERLVDRFLSLPERVWRRCRNACGPEVERRRRTPDHPGDRVADGRARALSELGVDPARRKYY